MVVPVVAVGGLQPGVAAGIDAGEKSTHETADDIVAACDIGRDGVTSTRDGATRNAGGASADHVVAVDPGACIGELDPDCCRTSRWLQPANPVIAYRRGTSSVDPGDGYVRGNPEHAGHSVVDDVGIGMNSRGKADNGAPARVVDLVPLHQTVVTVHDMHAVHEIVVETIVLDQMAGATEETKPFAKPSHMALAHGSVLPGVGVDAIGIGFVARSQSADLEVVAVDG